MRNITVAIDDNTYDRAAKQLAVPEAEVEGLNEQEREIRRQITKFAASDRLSRDELHQR